MGYPGGKSGPGVYHRLINLMPPHYTYVEPFLGGGAVMRLKRPARYNIGVDLDAAVIRQWRSRIGENALYCPGPIGGVAFADRNTLPGGNGGNARDRASGEPPIGDGPVRIGRNGDGGPQVAAPISADACGSTDGVLADPRRRRSVDSPIQPGPPRFRFLRGDALTFLQSYPFGADDLIYCDPPYLIETLSSRPRYKYNLSDEQHEELLATVAQLPCRFMISGYFSEIYARAQRKHHWNSITYEAMTRGGMATEWVWFNFEPPTVLHDYRYLGDTAHKRQDLKRQIASWTGKLARMPALKKQALLVAIAGVGESASAVRVGGNDAGIH